jgi:sugar-specific transcriptional regulator TrmB
MYSEYIETLEDFGLSSLQAKIYLVLLTLGKADATTIARTSNTARQEVYRIMPGLQKLGLGEKIIGKPVTYCPTPLDKGLSILEQKQKEKCEVLHQKKRWLVDNFHFNNGNNIISGEDAQLVIISEATLFVNTHKRIISKTKMSIDTILPQICFPTKLYQIWSQLEGDIATKKNLKVRVLTEKSENQKTISQDITKHPLFEFRFLTGPLNFGMHIFDKKELTLALSETSGLPSLWSNNLNLVNIAQNHFEMLWNTASKK